MRSRLLSAVMLCMVCATVSSFVGLRAAHADQATETTCRPKGAVCKVMNGKNPEPSNDLCCSSHCNWDNGAQNFLCD